MQVNRALKDKDMDRIDHALGRPLNPMAPVSRNYYSTGGGEAEAMAGSPHWREGRAAAPGARCFSVTDEGRKALTLHLRETGDAHRMFAVTFAGHRSDVPAISRSKARYSHYLNVKDVYPDLAFKDYCQRATVAAA